MTPEERAAIRSRHEQAGNEQHGYWCEYDRQGYPCDAIRLLDWAEQSIAALKANQDNQDNEIARLRAEVARLKAALNDVLAYLSCGQDDDGGPWFSVDNDPAVVEAIERARALAAPAEPTPACCCNWDRESGIRFDVICPLHDGSAKP